jgi:hypothetical protein
MRREEVVGYLAPIMLDVTQRVGRLPNTYIFSSELKEHAFCEGKIINTIILFCGLSFYDLVYVCIYSRYT